MRLRRTSNGRFHLEPGSLFRLALISQKISQKPGNWLELTAPGRCSMDAYKDGRMQRSIGCLRIAGEFLRDENGLMYRRRTARLLFASPFCFRLLF